jgi:hypothetical protein
LGAPCSKSRHWPDDYTISGKAPTPVLSAPSFTSQNKRHESLTGISQTTIWWGAIADGLLDRGYTTGILPHPTSRGSHGVETSRRVLRHYHESGPLDIPHLHDLHPCPNWCTCQGTGMENVKTTHLPQCRVRSLHNNGDKNRDK